MCVVIVHIAFIFIIIIILSFIIGYVICFSFKSQSEGIFKLPYSLEG